YALMLAVVILAGCGEVQPQHEEKSLVAAEIPSEEMGDPLEEANAAIDKNPHDATAYAERGDVWQQHGEFEKAIADYSEAIRLKPQAAIYFSRAQAWTALEQPAKALADYTDAIHLEPAETAFYFNRSGIYFGMGETEK